MLAESEYQKAVNDAAHASWHSNKGTKNFIEVEKNQTEPVVMDAVYISWARIRMANAIVWKLKAQIKAAKASAAALHVEY